MAARNIKLEIRLMPKESVKLGGAKNGEKLTCDLTSDDFDLSWVEFFEKQKRRGGLFRKILAKRNDYTVMDLRYGPDKRIWKLDSTIRVFIDSFKYNLPSYKAGIGRLPANTPGRSASQVGMSGSQPVPPATAGPSRRTRAPPRLGPLNAVIPSASRQMTPSGNQPPKQEHIQVEMEEDADAASMVNSQVSQFTELLHGEGIESPAAVKANFVKSVLRLNGTSLLLMREELKKLERDGQLVRVAMRIPRTMFLLNSLMKDPQ